MIQPYNIFYRTRGIRRIQSMLAPVLSILDTLPRDSMLHLWSLDPENKDVDTSKLYFGPQVKRILVDYPESLTSDKGSPRKLNIVLRELYRPWHVEHKRFKYLQNHYDRIRDQNTLFILNYGYLQMNHRYIQMPMTAYYSWWNLQKTIFDKIESISKEQQKNHFVFIDVPETLPSRDLLQLFTDKTTNAVTRIFDTPSKLFILEMWRWLNLKTRSDTVFANLSENSLIQVNLVFNVKDGRSCVLNLAYINSWIKGAKNTVEEFSNVSKLNSGDIQKLFLKLLMTLQSGNPDELMSEEQSVTASQEPTDPLDDQEDRDLQEEAANNEDEADTSHDHVDSHEYEDAISAVGRFGTADKKTLQKQLNKLEKDIDTSLQVADDVTLTTKLSGLDSDLRTLEVISQKKLKENGINIDDNGNLLVDEVLEKPLSEQEINDKLYKAETSEEALRRQIESFADYGLVSASDYKKLNTDIQKYNASSDPYGSGTKTVEKMVVTPEDIRLDKEKTAIDGPSEVLDKSMLQSSLQSFDSDYINNVIEKDTLSMIDGLQKAGIVIKSHEIEIDHTALGSYEKHAVEFKPIDGVSSIIHFRLPKIQPDGSFTASGNKYVMRKQRVDVPIRKISPSTVQLSSYYGKTFISINPKKANNSLEWIVKKINEAALQEHPVIKKVYPAKVFDNHFDAPYIYNGLADHFKMIITDKYTLVFDRSERENLFEKSDIDRLEVDGKRIVGRNNTNQALLIDKDNNFFVDVKGINVPIGDIYTVLQLDVSKAPVDFTEVRVFSNTIPVGVLLGYILGFNNLIKHLKIPYKYVESKRVGAIEPHEYAIQFADASYIFDRRSDKVANLIIAGFTDFHKETKKYPAVEFNSRNVYLNLLDSKGLGSIYIREIELTQQLFVDPITKGILQQMGEPETFNGLLIRSTEMLQTYHHPDPQDMKVMRIRGYERIPGAVYKDLVASIRQYKNKNIAGKSRIDIGPYQVWNSVMKDPAIKHVEDINPIQNLKETEIVTYVGEGGRGKDSINKPTRAYHKEDMGIVSEATVDSSDVGINAYLSANPNFKDLRGLPRKSKDINPTSLLSTSALLAPGSDHDDPKRVNFVSIQQSHTIAARGYHAPVIRTGYEYVIGSRTTDMFCSTAKKNGKVVFRDDKGLVVEYEDGTRKGIALGRTYGKAEGSVYPHDITSSLEVGKKFSRGDVLAYNVGFFEPDPFNAGRVLMKNSMTVKTVLYESNQTHEDSSAVSKHMSERLSADTTKVKSYVVNFNQNLRNVKDPGAKLSPKDILMLIEDEITSTSGVFDDNSITTLKRLGNQSPRASYLGTLDKIEVFYHGEKSDMSPTLKLLADRSDRKMAEICKASGKPVVSGEVTDEYRVGGVPLTLDKAEIRFYITVTTGAGVGDKVVFSNQLKSVIGEVMDYTMTTESGERIDAVFGNRSIMARVTLSPYIIGTTTTLMKRIGAKAAEIYRK